MPEAPQSNICATNNCPQFLSHYFTYLITNQAKSPSTLEATIFILREFCQFVHYRNTIREYPSEWDAHKDMNITAMELSELASVSQDDLEQYIAFLDNKTGNTTVTLSKKLSIIRTFFAYLVRMQGETGVAFPDGNPATRLSISIDRSDKSQIIISPAQMKQLISGVQGETQLRDRAIILLLCTTGLSLSELINLHVSDLAEDNWLRVNGARGVRYVWLTPPCRNLLQRYIISSDLYDDQQYLFSSNRNKEHPATARTVRNLISRAANNAQLTHYEITPKVLRDSVSNILYSAASEHETANIYHYLGYSLPSSHRHISPKSRLFIEDTAMKRIISRSPLSQLGISLEEDL